MRKLAQLGFFYRTGSIDLAGGMQLMSSNDERTITSSMTARETPARPMPRVAACAREKTFAKGLPSVISKIRNKRGPDRLVANDRAESGRDVEPFGGPGRAA